MERNGEREPNMAVVRAVTMDFAARLGEREMTYAEAMMVTDSLWRTIVEAALESSPPDTLENLKARILELTQIQQAWMMAWPASTVDPS